ncbi:MAG: hypothetical protein H6741_12975 [Alphaproteobacteria bacterium]|nr:hypothetical protein [Alphaproteobacteria bacterium]
MPRPLLLAILALLSLPGCDRSSGTGAPPGGWANTAPTRVERVVERGEQQLLEVRQGELRAWVQVPAVGAKVGDYVLLGQGEARFDVEIPELGERAGALVDIAHVKVVDREGAERAVAASVPRDAVPIGTVYAELAQRAGQEIVVHGTVVKATNAVGSVWVHLQDGTGDEADGSNDLTVQTQASVTKGQRVAFRGVLKADVDLGFGYHYAALVEGGELVE